MGKTGDRGYYLFGLRIVADFGATIAIPIVLLSWLGKRLDERWGTKPLMLVVGFAAAALLSGFGVYRKAKRYGKEYQKLNAPEG